ncbi:MAG: SDR family NAD(P)-dependent oxidoreductase [Elusimicrobiaceae bacterium]|nr:SDR family NAD(P)-dependent oxidoreductase [Elusimicrobiaceae bacterium]
MTNKNLEPIAIVGIGAVMPGALTKDEFWSNIQTGKYCITEIPASYWDYKLFYSPDHKAEDKLYSKIGGFIPANFQFNPLKYRIPPQIAKQMDTVQHLAIETTRMALEDAGYDKKEFDRNRTAVIIGNSMGGMKNEMSNTRLNRPFLYEILKNTNTFKSLAPASAQQLISEMDEGVRQKFTPVTEDSMPGELANVIAGRVANVFDLHGTNFTVDAACATSLAAVDQAVNGLRMGNYDMAIAGGVDQMMSPSAYIKFCKIGALSENGSCPFDAKADGFVMAEGAGMVILKRLSDAVKDGDRVYAVIRAVGASSDGKGKGITAPNPKGQKIAVEKTFEQLDYTPGDVGLVEAHGTSTRVGDAVELIALNELFAPYAKPGTIGLGSVKSQIGHAKAAAGIASLIKTSLALYNKVLPPSVNFVTPNPAVDWSTSPFRVITQAQPWPADKIRRANVSAFGFGGTNFHVALEEMNDDLLHKKTVQVASCAVTPKQESTPMKNSYILHVPGEKIQSDVLTFSAATKQELFNVLDKALVAIQCDPTYLPSISYKNHMAKPGKFAVTINVETAEKLKEKIEFFKKTASSQDVWEQSSLYLRMKGIYPFTPTEIKPKVCFMFPGQGSQYVDMMKDLASKYKIVQDTFDEADRLLTDIIGQTLTETLWSKPGETKEQIAEREAAIRKTEMTQPAVLTADIAMMRLLSSFGIKPDVVMGHSLGEYAAAVAAGIFDFENGLKAVCTRGKVMSEIRVEDNGKMASIAAPVERVEPELARVSGYVAVANKNCPTQTVIAGASKSIDDAIKMFTDMGIQAVQIPVSHAFHSAIVQPAMPQYRAFLNTLTVRSPKMPITTNVTAEFYPNDPEKIKDLMVTQISHSVEWIKQLQTTYDSGVRLFVECGPKRVLSALASNTLSDKKDIKVLSSNHPKKGGIVEFNDLFANLISSGIQLDWTGTDIFGNNTTYNPAFVDWVTGNATSSEKAAACVTQQACVQPVSTKSSEESARKSIVISGIAAGGPGSWDKIFREGVLDEILSGRNMIEPVSAEIQQKQIDKHVEFVIKSKDGNHRFERLTSAAQAIKLSAKGGAFDLEKEFGLPAKWVRSMDRSFQLAIAAGILALKDAGIPLVLYYKPTSTGGYLPDRWGLPAEMIDETGVIFTSAFPVANSMMGDLTKRVTGLLNNKTAKEVRAFCDKFISQIADPALKAEIETWYQQNFKDKEIEPQAFTSEFILKTIIIAHSHFCQWIRARGPATAMSAACASTAQAIAVAQDWIKLGRCKRVIVISADDITNDNVSEWILTAFLASGAATTQADVTQAALPFDRRRNGMIVGMGAVSLVVEEENEVLKRGMKPLAKLLATEIANSGFHVTRIDVGHVAKVMDRLVSTAEKENGLNRADIAKQLVFISHETYTPARGGSASAEAYALKSTFGENVSQVIVSNTKGFTGHSMGAGLEDAIAVRCLNTGLVPPIANFKEADPELEGITLSKGGHYDFKYALRLAAGFGSQLGMTLLEKAWQEGEPRICDTAKHDAWLKEISGQQTPVLEVVQNTLRIKDNYKHGVKPALVMEGSQAFVDKVNTVHAVSQSVATPAVTAPVTPTVAPAPVAVAPAPAVVSKPVDENTVTKEVVNMVAEKTGYPEDMLDLDLDMEADLGIDTVKQAELFAAMREHYGIAQQEGIQLKDYPTIRHCIKFVLANAGGTASAEATPAVTAPVTPAVAPAPVAAAPAPAVVSTPAQTVEPAVAEQSQHCVDTVQEAVPSADKVEKPSEEMLTTNPTAPIQRRESLAERPEREGYAGEHCHEKKLRNVTVVAPAPLAERENRRLSKDRTILIFADNSQLIKAYQEECKELGVKYHVFTTLKTRSKNTTIVNWESYEETEAALKEYAAEDPNVQGIVYLLGANVKKFDKKLSPHNELTKYVMPLFIALRVFEKGLANRTDADTFFAVNTKIDGTFGYTTKDEFNPITGALCGGTTCYRKDVYERTGAIAKLLDFEPTVTPDEMAQKTMDEVLHGDMRLMIGTRGGERSTILSVPVRLDRSVKHVDLTGKTIIFTGSGRGIGAMLSQKIAAQYHSKIIVLDIIEIQEKTPLWAKMNEAELAVLKKQLWEDLKADPSQKATPVLLERAFGRVKDSITLYNNLQKLRELGSEVEYYHCDVLNSSMVKEVCTKIKAKNGRVDGLIHFAGLERSKLIYDKDPAEYYRIFDVKATSFASFLANNIVRDGGFFAFASSIAGKYGNLGQSDYASANDYLAKSAFSLTNQGYRAIAIAMSAYKNVGMGVRAGVETFLRSNGVDFVDPEDGMQIFLDEIVYGTVPEIVLTGSLGRLDWDHQLRFEMDEIIPKSSSSGPTGGGANVSGNSTPAVPQPAVPASSTVVAPVAQATHFLGTVTSLVKGAEIHLEKEFNLTSDPYLADHAIEGTPYVPGVMGLETFMETATALTGQVPQGLKDVHFYLPIKLLRNRPQAVRVIGKMEGTQAVMEIESDFINSKGIKMGNTRRHFTAKTLDGFVSTWPSVRAAALAEIHTPISVTKEEIYQKYFHGPSFQVLGGILRVDKNTSLAVYNTTPRPQWLDGPRTLLANPMLIEAAFQCCGFQDMSIERKMTLPDGIAEVAVLKDQVPPATLYLYGVNRGFTADGKTLHDAYVFDQNGELWIEFHGYQAIGQ